MPYNNTNGHFPLGIINNPLTDSIYTQDYSNGLPSPPPVGTDRWIDNNGDFIIDNNGDFIIFNT